ncbi:MAG: histidine kinase, partial [Desulfovibrio sp.]|nr:histidine kinase [Desulfovibrio sp.]
RIQGISKLFIPHEILVKEGKLTEDEHAKIREAQTMANSLIQSFDFHLPVSDTINQSTERMDGTGRPAGLKGEAILKTARVLAAINAFCAMTSPRKYRGAMTPEAAIAELEANPGYDQQVVASLRQVTQEDIAG